ncbi:ABC transporter permease [Geobacillus thermoleovorans]|uniref:ABC transporter permease n=1 Tax=Geobacillus thermoleovorans TaxID=33941 RepID=A0A2Z3N6R9_GEOTH|nr:ABC transporter permease [Geobacillus thermoleovorans]AWO73379.1 ABC transporter permease [Geobacillus thermoleovorans]QNU21954.1 ABC transporter permease [Geobacillus thermoleovorans]
MRWKWLFVFYWKRLLKSKLYIGASFSFFLLLAVRFTLFFTDPYNMESYGDIPHEVFMLVQIVSLFYIVWFYLLYSNELRYGVSSWFADGYRILLEKMSALLAVHALYQGIMLMMSCGVFSIVYLFVGVEPSDLYLSLLRFLAVYQFGPLVLTVLYGVIIALLLETKKVSFFAMLLVWILTGPMTTELFIDLSKTVHARDWASLLFIGKHAIQRAYDSYIGFEVDRGGEWKWAAWFLSLVGLALLSSIRFTQTRKERNAVLKAFLVFPFLIVLTAYHSLQTNTKAFTRADQTTELEEYRQMKQETKADLRYRIQSYDLSLHGSRAVVRVALSQLETNRPTFQLYHLYPLHSIEADHQPVKFTRNGDLVTVWLPKRTSTLTFSYEIVDTALIPYTNGRIVLLADRAWYPKKRATHMYRTYEYRVAGTRAWGGAFTDQFFPDETYTFTLNVDGDVLFCNVPKRGTVYRGKAQAVTLIKGQGHQLVDQGYEITYPADWPHMAERAPTVIHQMEKTFRHVQQIASTAVSSLPNKIVFSSFGLSSFLANDHLVYNTNDLYGIDQYIMEQNFYEKILRLSVPPKGSRIMYNEWISLATRWLMQKNDLPVIDWSSKSEWFESQPSSVKKQIEAIYQAFQPLDVDQKQQCLRTWYANMDDGWTWDRIFEMMQEVNGVGGRH